MNISYEKGYILCFCIATYNRKEAVLKNIQSLLSIDSKKFSVVVTDNHSTDGTIESLSQIKDERFYFYQNEKNLGADKNWYESLNNGIGKYLFELNDKDVIDNSKVPELISILEKENFVCGYAYPDNVKNNNKIVSLRAGKESILRLGCWTPHTTGCIFCRESWKSHPEIQKYFDVDKFGSGPQCAAFMILGKLGRCMEIYNGVYLAGKSYVDFVDNKSKVFLGKYNFHLSRDYQINAVINLSELLFSLELGKEDTEECFQKLTSRGLKLCTIKAYMFLQDPIRRSHYNRKRAMKKFDIILVQLIYIFQIKEYAKKKNLLSPSMRTFFRQISKKDFLLNDLDNLHLKRINKL